VILRGGGHGRSNQQTTLRRHGPRDGVWFPSGGRRWPSPRLWNGNGNRTEAIRACARHCSPRDARAAQTLCQLPPHHTPRYRTHATLVCAATPPAVAITFEPDAAEPPWRLGAVTRTAWPQRTNPHPLAHASTPAHARATARCGRPKPRARRFWPRHCTRGSLAATCVVLRCGRVRCALGC